MRKSLRFALVLLALAQQLPAQNTSAGEQSKSLIDQASRAMRLFRQTDPSMKRFFFRSVGWAVYPRIANAGVLLGGAYGKGVVYQRGVIIGFSELRQFTAGLQLGGRQYSEIVFFADKPTLQRFRQGRIKIDPDTQGIRTARGNAADARPPVGCHGISPGKRWPDGRYLVRQAAPEFRAAPDVFHQSRRRRSETAIGV